jgi:hypothetical protein
MMGELMEYTEEEVIKMMEAYAEAASELEALNVIKHMESGETYKRPLIARDMAKTCFEIFEEIVPESLREKLKTKRKQLEEELKKE